MFSSSHRKAGRPQDAVQAPRTDLAPPADDTTGTNAAATAAPDGEGTVRRRRHADDENDRGDERRDGGPDADGLALWGPRTRIVLTPLAAPSIVGLFGFMGATLMVGAWQAGWYGSPMTPAFIFPFAVMFGGVMQGVAAFYALRARDGLAAAVHATWGAFWLGYGLYFGLVVGGLLPVLPLGAKNPNFAMWFVVLTAITVMMALAATVNNWNIAAVLWTLSAGAGLTAAGMWGGYLTITHIGGVLFVISAGIAWYAACAMVFENVVGRTVLPIFKPKKAAVVPGGRATVPVQYAEGMPGVRVGQ